MKTVRPVELLATVKLALGEAPARRRSSHQVYAPYDPDDQNSSSLRAMMVIY
jgi:hypothetical protein